MATKTRLVRDEVYEELGAAYQVLLASVLNDALKDHGVAARKVRRAVCEQFLIQAGVLHDQFWLTAAGKTVYPLLCFAETFPDGDPARLGTLYAPSAHFSFDEYAGGAAVYFFDEHKETTAGIEAGPVGRADDAPAEAGAGSTDDYKEWRLRDGTEFTCWLGGEPAAGAEFYVWAGGPAGPVEYRVRRGKEVERDWTRLRKTRDQSQGPMFRAGVVLDRGTYAIDFRTGGEVFSAIRVRLR